MTTPHINGSSSMPEGVLKVDQLGDNLQGLNAAKINSTVTDRMTSNFLATPGGLTGGPIRFINGLFANFFGGIADDAIDSPTVSSPEDVRGLTNPLFGELVRESGHTPIIGDIIEVITGVEDGDTSDLGTWVNNLRSWLTGGTVATDPGNWFDGLGNVAQNIIDSLLTGYKQTASTGTADDLVGIGTNIANRLTSLESGGVANL